MQNLRDQLLKTGLATKTQKHQVEHEKRRERKQQKKGHMEDAALELQRQAHAARLEAQRVSDRQRAAERRAALDAQEARLRLHHIIDYWQLPGDTNGTRRWYFTTRQHTIEYLYVSEPVAAQLSAGTAAIVERPDHGESRYVLVDREAAEHIFPIDCQYVRFANNLRTETADGRWQVDGT
jgi:uncharacterized protein YaiL (DUF2058 family)